MLQKLKFARKVDMEMRFILDGLCCPVCAANIENRIRQLEGVAEASVDFTARRLLMRLSAPDKAGGIAGQVAKLVKDIEPDVAVRSESAGGGEGKLTEKAKEEETGRPVLSWARLGLGAALFAAALILRPEGAVRLGLFSAAYLLIGGDILLKALKNIRRGRVFDENFLMAIASLGAFAIGEYPEGVAVMLFYQVGEAFQDMAMRRSRASISALMDIRPDYANLKRDSGLERVDPREVHPGDLILVKPGEKVPLDGLITEGRSALDCSALTGESLPRDVEPGSEVLSGSINKTGPLSIRVSKEFGESTAAKILELVQNAGSRKAPVENFITRFARYYTPVVVFAAVVLALIPPLFLGFSETFPSWLHRALVFLVVSCPCALVISVPLSFFGGIGGASRRGILVKGGNYLEALNRADTVVFDKTGTLTRGIFTVTGIVPARGFSREELLRWAAAAESFSNHPIARSIQKAAAEQGIKIEEGEILSHEEIPGRGIRALLAADKAPAASGDASGSAILAGNRRLLEEAGVPFPGPETAEAGFGGEDRGAAVYVARDGVYAGHLEISDEPKPDARTAIQRLKALKIRRVLMFTGDNSRIGGRIAQTLGLDAFYGELLPQDKVAQLEALYPPEPAGKPPKQTGTSSRSTVVFVGDGINDAPVLARSDVGVAMGGAGQDAAIEAADIVLMTDEPSRLADAILIARKTHRIVWQNIIFALGVKGIILVLGALGIASMWAAVFGDVGVAFIAILNALRAMNRGDGSGSSRKKG
jgi:Cd2+/Zn2+-exporting ATPase